MLSEITIRFSTRGRMWPTLAYMAAVTASSLRLYNSSHASGPWIIAVFVIIIGIPIFGLFFHKQIFISHDPKMVRRELLFIGIKVKTELLDPEQFNWVRSRMNSFDPRDAIIELGIRNSYDAITIQKIKYAMAETPEIISIRRQIAAVLRIDDRGHERLPIQRKLK
ncbi:hypothetical protein OVY01_19295 [Robbsia sp. Bb-Pol-6]|uniref:Uncharacterized protein n=1 Tax=Robbsia betulipollinis TaxID=2981849 RepID=A0ABT3ZRW5_9BURK|nr:hypothetical protein [Robbsia betulipollinis]MCY0389296.1 hypothetical protein [Robbsia betulipollinis]